EPCLGARYADVGGVGKAPGHVLPISAALFCREELEQVWELGEEDVYTHTHTGSPLASAAALVVLEEVPKLLERVQEAGERFEREGWHGKGLLRAREGDADEALRRGVIVVPAGPGGRLLSATPPLTITDAELDGACSLHLRLPSASSRSGRTGRERGDPWRASTSRRSSRTLPASGS